MDKYTVATSIKKVFASVSAVAIIGTAFVGGQSAFAAESTAVGSTTINGGTLSISDLIVSTFGDIDLNGEIQTKYAKISDLTVIDPTGTGAGWDVTVKATQLTTGEDETGNTLMLPKDSLKISEPIVTAGNGSSGADTVVTSEGTIDNETGITLLSANEEGGMGTYTVTFPEDSLELKLNPKDVKTGTYTSTITVTITTGP